eukprot:scaffold34685_cov183-Amphora_coffeaeformis.AAC.6
MEYRVVGTNRFRSLSSTACTLHARAQFAFDSVSKAAGEGPTVDTVIRLALRPKNSCAVS